MILGTLFITGIGLLTWYIADFLVFGVHDIRLLLGAIGVLVVYIIGYIKFQPSAPKHKPLTESAVSDIIISINNNSLLELTSALHNVNSKQLSTITFEGLSVLKYAAQKKVDPDIIKCLIDANAYVENSGVYGQDHNYSAYYLAVHYPYFNTQLARTLIRKGINVNFTNQHQVKSKGLSLLNIFTIKGNESIVSLLLSNGADASYFIDGLAMNSIMLASKYCQNSNIVSQLITSGASVNDYNKSGYSPIIYAAEFNPNPHIVSTLIKAGANLKSHYIQGHGGKMNNVTPLRVAIENQNSFEVIQKLIDAGDSIHSKDSYGISPLMAACLYNDDPRVIDLLVKSGSPINAADQYHNTPLMAACFKNPNPNVINVLLQHKASISAVNKQNYKAIDYLILNQHIRQDNRESLMKKMQELHDNIGIEKESKAEKEILNAGAHVDQSEDDRDINVNYSNVNDTNHQAHALQGYNNQSHQGHNQVNYNNQNPLPFDYYAKHQNDRANDYNNPQQNHYASQNNYGYPTHAPYSDIGNYNSHMNHGYNNSYPVNHNEQYGPEQQALPYDNQVSAAQHDQNSHGYYTPQYAQHYSYNNPNPSYNAYNANIPYYQSNKRW